MVYIMKVVTVKEVRQAMPLQRCWVAKKQGKRRHHPDVS